MKKHLPKIIVILVFFVGLSVMLYPTISEWWNKQHQTRAVTSYTEEIQRHDDSELLEMVAQAKVYNQKLSDLQNPFYEFSKLHDAYDAALSISGNEVMGIISIPAIDVRLPIYHGTEEKYLQIGAGHVEGSSLPVGGENTHAVISGHRGLPSARLFTDLDQLVEGDTFTITILNQTLVYEIEEILVILPEQTEYLEVIPGGDYVTLMTCTPYGVNSHRLLLRSHRVGTVYDRSDIRVPADAMQVDRFLAASIAAVPMVLALLLYWWIPRKKRKKFPVNKKYEILRKAGL